MDSEEDFNKDNFQDARDHQPGGIIDLAKFDEQCQLEEENDEESKEVAVPPEKLYDLEKARSLKE